MMKKLLTIGAAVALVLAVAFVAAGDSGNAVACKDKAGAKASTASNSSSSCSAKAATATASTKSAGACTAGSGCCAAGKAAVAGYAKGECGDKAAASAASLAEITDEVPYGEAKRVVVTGTMACGSCTYHKTAACAPLVKTKDGKVYPLVKNQMIERLHQANAEEGVELSTRVRKIDGVKYLEVLSFRAL